MARTRRIKKDSDAHYHLMSRTNDRRFLFESGEVKSELVSALRRAADIFQKQGASAAKMKSTSGPGPLEFRAMSSPSSTLNPMHLGQSFPN